MEEKEDSSRDSSKTRSRKSEKKLRRITSYGPIDYNGWLVRVSMSNLTSICVVMTNIDADLGKTLVRFFNDAIDAQIFIDRVVSDEELM